MDYNNLKQGIEKFIPILDANADALAIEDKYGKIIYTNNAYTKMIKRGNGELVADSRDIVKDDETYGKVIVYHDISEINRLRRELDRLNQKLRKVQTKYTFKDIVGEDPVLLNTIKKAKSAAMTPATILIRGESGTGKEVFAQAIHNTSNRRNEKLVMINCSSIPEELLESELFGYVEGAFTGANRGGKRGLFQEADKGTLFLDEVGDVSSRMQVKLLRVLQEREIMPVGSMKTIPIDVRIICATNKPLEEMIERGEFREDLYYRLNVFPLFIPPLRERLADINLILKYLLNQYNEFYNRNVEDITSSAIKVLVKQQWRGNVRELQNVLSRVLIGMDEQDKVITVDDILPIINGEQGHQLNEKKRIKSSENNFESLPLNISEAIEETERRCIIRALEKNDGDKNKAAVDLGVSLRTLYYKCNKLRI